MVEKPIEEVNLPSAVQEAKPVRQQAAVRNITPSQPAPMYEKKIQSEQTHPSFLDRVFGWFKPISSEEKKATEPEQAKIKLKQQDRGRRGREGRDRERSTKKIGDVQQRRGVHVESMSETGGALIQGQEVDTQHSPRGEQKNQEERPSHKKQSRSSRNEKVKTEAKSLTKGEQLPLENQMAQGEDSVRSRRRRGGRQRDRAERLGRDQRGNEQISELDKHSTQTIAMRDEQTHEKTVELHADDAVAKPISNETSILSSSRQQEAKVSSVAEPIPPVKTTVHTDQNVPEMGSDVSQVMSDEGEKLPVVKKPVEEKIISLVKSAPTTEVEEPFQDKITGVQGMDLAAEPEVSSEPEPKVIQQPPISGDIKSQDLIESGLVMIETIPGKRKTREKVATTKDSALPKQRRGRPIAQPAVEHGPLVQIETHK
jgi:ribonuclease E